MNGNHLTGGIVGLLIGAVAARYGWNLSDQEAALIGATFASLGGVVAHLATGPGIWPGVKRAIMGPKPSN